MYSLKVELSFSAAHNLRGYKGKCEELHGHNWEIEMVVSKNAPDKTGMVADFTYLKVELNRVLEKLDHKYLNNIPYFKKNNPTSENIAKYIYDCLEVRLSGVRSITVWESDKCCATYEKL